MFGRIPLWSYLVLYFAWSIIISFSLLLIGLFRLYISSWFCLGRLHVSRNVSISSRLSNLLVYNCSSYFLMIFCISVVLVVISPFPFLILFIWVLSLFFLASLAKGLSILFTLSENQLLVLLIFFLFFLISFIYFLSDLYFSPSADLSFLLFLILLGGQSGF